MSSHRAFKNYIITSIKLLKHLNNYKYNNFMSNELKTRNSTK